MYILLALLRSWGELNTEESEGENEFGSGENLRMMNSENIMLVEHGAGRKNREGLLRCIQGSIYSMYKSTVSSHGL